MTNLKIKDKQNNDTTQKEMNKKKTNDILDVYTSCVKKYRSVVATNNSDTT